MHWRVSFIGDFSESCTSDLVADRKVCVRLKRMLRASLLKGDHGNAQMAGCWDVAWWLHEPSRCRGLMGSHAY